MSRDVWSGVEAFIEASLISRDPVLEETLRVSAEAGLPAIQVSPNEGKLLHLLARIQRARAILEIGTLGGYSTIWLARALPRDGKLVTLEASEPYAAVARSNIARAGLSDLVDLRVGLALQTLPQLAADGDGPFDLVFLDADKSNNPEYFQWALKLSRPGSLIIADNVVRGGAVTDSDSDDPAIQGIRRFYELVAAEQRVDATAIQTVGSKGHDGLAFLLVTED